MPQSSRIATCCYCGTRAVLVMRQEGRHELSCSACGAPLHALKQMPVDRAASAPRDVPPKRERQPRPAPYHGGQHRVDKPRPSRRKSRRKGIWSRVLDEAFDAIEDIFD